MTPPSRKGDPARGMVRIALAQKPEPGHSPVFTVRVQRGPDDWFPATHFWAFREAADEYAENIRAAIRYAVRKSTRSAGERRVR